MQGDERALLSVVIPARNEAEGIQHALEVIADTLSATAMLWEIIVVDDGSRDNTFDHLRTFNESRGRIHALRLSRNFGKESALLAGLAEARGSAVITMDADLQHPPSAIPKLIMQWRAGAKIVHAVKTDRRVDSFLSRLRASIFNSLMTSVTGIDVNNSSDFKLLDRSVVDILVNGITERERFYRGLVNWVGFRQAVVPFSVAARHSGHGKWSFLALLKLATTAVVAFSGAPLRIVTALGLLTLILGILVGSDALVSWANGKAVSGFATIIITLLLIGSFIMVSLGIIGEYIAKIYEEMKCRPPYLVEDRIELGASVGKLPLDQSSHPSMQRSDS